MTPLERAARAACDAAGYDWHETSDGSAYPIADEWRKADRAVLTAIRDINTDDDVEIAMLMAGRAQLPEHDEPMQEDAANCLRAMIDAMLAEEG